MNSTTRRRRAHGAPFLISFVGPSRSGKTTLLAALIAEISRRGYRVGAVKHSLRGFELDREGKDSDRFRRAGARGVLLASPDSIGFLADAPRGFSPRDAAAFFPDADIVLVEGWKEARLPKVAVAPEGWRVPRGRGLIAAVGKAAAGSRIPRFEPGDVRGIAEFLIGRMGRAT